jgi:hypothetical protein
MGTRRQRKHPCVVIQQLPHHRLPQKLKPLRIQMQRPPASQIGIFFTCRSESGQQTKYRYTGEVK